MSFWRGGVREIMGLFGSAYMGKQWLSLSAGIAWRWRNLAFAL